MANVIHGGRLNVAASAFNIPRQQWLDLSTGINPQNYPLANMPVEHWQRLPESDDGLEDIAAEYYQCQTLMMTPGSQWSIERLPIWLQRLESSGGGSFSHKYIPPRAWLTTVPAGKCSLTQAAIKLSSRSSWLRSRLICAG